MSPKIKRIFHLIENISYVLLGIASLFCGAFIWDELPALTLSLYAAAMLATARGIGELSEILYAKENPSADDESPQDDKH